MKEIKITGTKWYVDIEYKENIARFGGEMCVDGFYATVNSISWIKHQGYIEKNELTELIKAVRKQIIYAGFLPGKGVVYEIQ